MRRSLFVSSAALALVLGTAPPAGASDHASDHPGRPELAGRAVLPAATVSDGPPSGAALVPAGLAETTINGIRFPRPGQPVIGFSAIARGRRPGEVLAMPDNGFGGKANSRDFLIRAYYLTPSFKTPRGGSGDVAVGDHVQFADPFHRFGAPIVREATPERWLTGADIDPESLQRGRHGDLWVGDEFGPWLLHFSATGTLLEAPIPLPGGLASPNNPFLVGAPTVANSRGLEAMAMSPDGRYLYPMLEGALVAEAPSTARRVFQYDLRAHAFTGRTWTYRMQAPGYFLADAWAVDEHRIAVIERDGGSGLGATFRQVRIVDLRDPSLASTLLVDLAAVPDPHGVSLPPLRPGDVGLGDPFRLTCESAEALYVLDGSHLLVGCDDNLPNTGRNPGVADDSEFVVVSVPGLVEDR